MVVVAGMEPSIPSTAYTRHFRVGCHACVEGLSLPSPPALLFLTEFCVSMCEEAAPGLASSLSTSGKYLQGI